MKHLALGLLTALLLTTVPAAYAQGVIPAVIEYSERVADEDSETAILYQRTLDWTENHFAYTPKATVRADAAKAEVRISGTTKVRTSSNSGQLQDCLVLFEFSFRALPTGYEYSVEYFRVVPNLKKPEETVPFEEFVAQLALERNNARTHNDRRVMAQATSLASEVAMSFRSYMNSRPATGAISEATK